MKVLILGPDQKRRYNWGHQLFKAEVARQADVRVYGPGYEWFRENVVEIRDICDLLEFTPDAIMTYMGKYCMWARGLSSTSIQTFHVVIDYFPWDRTEDDFIRENAPGLIFTKYLHELHELQQKWPAFKVRWLPFSVDTTVFQDMGLDRTIDVMAVFSVVAGVYPTRAEILRVLGEQKDLECLLLASWPRSRLLHMDYVRALASSKIMVNGLHICRSMVWKFYEPCACGAMLLTEEADDMDRLGFEDGKNCVLFSGVPDMLRKARWFLEHDDERKRISQAGANLVRGEHTDEIRVGQMLATVREEFEL